jgi:2-amino-4-hydroxy-6-hydroxymethyldihydropteridine diphosphokinase
MPRSLIALGSNLGDREHTLRHAIKMISAHPAVSNVSASSLHETAPIGGPSRQGPFVNAAVALDASLAPEALGELLQRAEMELGRRPGPRWAARPIDLDLALFGDQVINTKVLSVPHPRMAFRRFVLAPAAEVAPGLVHPLIGWTIDRLLSHLDTAAPYVAILGMPDSGRASLARDVAQAAGGTYLADPTAADSSGRTQRTPIEFLGRASQSLQSRDWRTTRATVISDFYFDECLAYAHIDLDASAYRQFVDEWAQARSTLIVPKLLVVLDAWGRGVAVWQERAGSADVPSPPSDRLRYELLRLAARGDQGPVLYAGSDDRQAQFDEITAAIAAMK